MYPGVHVLILIEAIIGLGYLPDNIRSEKPVINPHEFAKVRWIGGFVCDRRQCHIMPVQRFWMPEVLGRLTSIPLTFGSPASRLGGRRGVAAGSHVFFCQNLGYDIRRRFSCYRLFNRRRSSATFTDNIVDLVI